ncbi:MAG: N-acetylmuramoyl-L-alanine amidase [Thermodesulfobacteriota bacterium]
MDGKWSHREMTENHKIEFFQGKWQPAVLVLMWPFLSFLFLGAILSSECGAEDFKIAIDIGHTKLSPGALSARGVPEYQFNQSIGALLHQNLLKDQRFKGSFIINETGGAISLSARAAIANRRGAALFVSIHHDSVEPKDLSYWVYQGENRPYCDKFAGHSIFYSEENGNPLKSLVFAIILGSEMLRQGFCPTLHHAEKFTGGDKDLIDRTRGIYKYNKLVVLKSTKMPAVLFECGIIKSRDEELIIRSSKYQNNIVKVLINAINIYFVK